MYHARAVDSGAEEFNVFCVRKMMMMMMTFMFLFMIIFAWGGVGWANNVYNRLRSLVIFFLQIP